MSEPDTKLRIHVRHGVWKEVPAWSTCNSYLRLNVATYGSPSLNALGLFCLAHAPTGRWVIAQIPDIATGRQIAEKLTALGLDWSLEFEPIFKSCTRKQARTITLIRNDMAVRAYERLVALETSA